MAYSRIKGSICIMYKDIQENGVFAFGTDIYLDIE